MADRGIHGAITDSDFLQKMLDLGNQLRYGKTEGERVEMVNRLAAPGVTDAAYNGPANAFDPAAAERYTSAYLFGDKYGVPEGLQPLLHHISSGGREAMHAVGVPGVGEERPELRRAEELGMSRGAGRQIVRAKPSSAFLRALLGER